jgi:hypothetical protein
VLVYVASVVHGQIVSACDMHTVCVTVFVTDAHLAFHKIENSSVIVVVSGEETVAVAIGAVSTIVLVYSYWQPPETVSVTVATSTSTPSTKLKRDRAAKLSVNSIWIMSAAENDRSSKAPTVKVPVNELRQKAQLRARHLKC